MMCRSAVILLGCLGWLLTVGQSSIAPSDQFFGNSSLSTASIRSGLNQISILIEKRKTPEIALTRLIVLQNAVDDWAARYPADPAARNTYAEICQDMRLLQNVGGGATASEQCDSAFKTRYP